MKLTIALILGAVLTLCYMLRKIRKSQLQTSDAIFWFVFAVCLVIIAIFPQIVFFLSDLLGIQSPSNFVFLCVVAVLLLREFIQTAEIARLKEKMAQLAQTDALNKKL
ncbi:DUF2304 domain-containing protein [Adlercreutzia sp. ZJ154]|uniref:DUF2304 domain-containing protein n=1 Tax=Adlercreutzia sp. ZJ154 TaxID=2709790 RepID=UPI0013EB1F68|nr:DUF2304 domain-containing protein [Adlercreutzia sp. ZJ154]